jgi:hypothetical protein
MKSKNNRNHKNLFLLLLDTFLLAGFWLLNQFRLTGIVIHEWFGVAFGLILLLHLALHWRWVLNMFRKFFRVNNIVQYVKLILDIAGLNAFFTVIVSGILMSRSFLPALGLTGMHSRSLKMLHVTATNATIAMVVLHLLLNVKWIVKTIGRKFVRSDKPVSDKLPQPE